MTVGSQEKGTDLASDDRGCFSKEGIKKHHSLN